MSVSKESYDFYTHFLESKIGMALGSNKEYLLESRLQPICEELNLKTLDDLAFYLKTHSDPALNKKVTLAMATHESLFFRDNAPFEYLAKTLFPRLVEKKAMSRQLRIWSCGCSTGQEPYSIAITLMKQPVSLENWSIEIFATDLSLPVIQKAKSGVYSAFEVQRGISEQDLKTYFTAQPAGWEISQAVKKRVRFQELNLIEPFGEIGIFDVILCRNVLIYVNAEKKKAIIDKFADRLPPEGILILGGTESLMGLTDRFVTIEGVHAPVYRKVR